jgi:alpha-tubulin suppressor-like RCC1 family protein
MAVTEEGRLFTFVYGASGQLGHSDTNSQDVPAEVGEARLRCARVVFAAAGGLHSAVVTMEGRVFTWGYGVYGQLGHNDEHDQLVPTEVAGELGGCKAVTLAAGDARTMVVTHDGALWGCGRGEHGQLGMGDRADRLELVRVGMRRRSGSQGC